ncbi:MAG TPA: hypothetical protein VF531_06195 [Bacillota bacterium]
MVDSLRWRLLGLVDYKTVEIYADFKDNLIVIPSGATVDSVQELHHPYNDAQLVALLTMALAKSTYHEGWDQRLENILEQYLGVAEPAEAIRGRRLVFFSWSRRGGYSVTPTKALGGLNVYELPGISLGKRISGHMLVHAVKQALKTATPPRIHE